MRELKRQDGSAMFVACPSFFVTAHNDTGTIERIHTVLPGAPVLSKPVYRDKLAEAVSLAIH